jgi:hypothetical protein
MPYADKEKERAYKKEWRKTPKGIACEKRYRETKKAKKKAKVRAKAHYKKNKATILMKQRLYRKMPNAIFSVIHFNLLFAIF